VPALCLDSFQLKPAVTGSAEDLIEVLLITIGIADLAFACLFVYALAYKDNRFLSALLRVILLWWGIQVYLTASRHLVWFSARKLNPLSMQGHLVLSAAMVFLSFVGSFIDTKT